MSCFAPQKNGVRHDCHQFHPSDSDGLRCLLANGSSAGAAFSPDGRFLPPNRQKKYCDKGNRHKSTLKMAMWNCGGLTATCWGMCEEAGYDSLALTETHCANPTHGRGLLMSAPTPVNDRFSGVALMISDRMAHSLTFSGSVSSRIILTRFQG